ncbi:endo-1,4-beta-xylanase 5-like [Phragmites australis]|uniref:endo-1,4-beta-xylanase 5-like n=1 Tax=Phragmites australis TaxID=29695 RepID=UPI002D78A645|nr:endo-1,4-beta-xylanase 5-like [Phragmites australis]
MKVNNLMEKLVLWFLWIALLQGCMVKSLPYDYSATIQCLPEPLEPQYGGGILRNADFSAGLLGWSAFGYGSVCESVSAAGNGFAMALNRTLPYQSVSQKVYLQNDTHYTLSAWFQVSDGSADVQAIVKIANDFIHAGGVVAKAGCWSMLKGGLTAASSGPAELYFESNATVDIWVDSVSLKPFSKDEWTAHRAESTVAARKKMVRLQATDSSGNPLEGAAVSMDTVRNGFPLGAAMSRYILTNSAYQTWFASRFAVTTFENEMKWYSTEPVPGREDYSVPDAMLAFAKSNGIAVRGHNVFWDQPSQQPGWVQSLPYPQLLAAASRRIRSVVSRYAGQVIGWDVVNENLHFNFYEGRFGWDASTAFYAAARLLDAGSALMFMNEFNTLEQPGDMAALPGRYLQRLRQIIASYPENGAGMAIGLEGHFTTPNIPYMRAALDTLAQAGIPVWLTEVDVAAGPSQAEHLEEVLREAYAHPAVQGIVLWSAWQPEGCYVMCLTDNEFNNLPQGDVVDRLIAEWRATPRAGATDAQGYFEAELVHGEYKVTVSHPSLNSSVSRSIKVELGSGSDHYFIDVQV